MLKDKVISGHYKTVRHFNNGAFKKRLCLLCLLVLIVQIGGTGSQVTGVLPDDYDKNETPKSGEAGMPLVVNVSIGLERIFDVTEKTQMISIDTFVRMSWIDPRVKISLPPNDTVGFVTSSRDSLRDILWLPDIYIMKMKDIRKPSFSLLPQYFRIFPGGRVDHSMLSNYDLHCPMDFSWYPVDVQECHVVFESYGHMVHIMDMNWDRPVVENTRMNQQSYEVNFTKGSENYTTGLSCTLISTTLMLIWEVIFTMALEPNDF